MTSDLGEVYDFIFLPDGQKLYSPKHCGECDYVRDNNHPLNIRKCPVCGHLTRETFDTADKVEINCWCGGLLKYGYIEKEEDYPEFYKKCLIDSLHQIEKIGISCKMCKKRKSCEDGGTNVHEIINTKGYCEDVVL